MGGFRPGLARLAALAALLLGAALSLGATAQESDIGEAISIVKSVRGVIANKERVLAPKDRVFADEQILTGPASASQLRFLDDTVLTIGPDSDVLLDEFVFDAAPENQKLVINASVGVLRFVTGKLGKLNYKIKTPTATIGVRGTIFTIVVLVGGAIEAFVEAGALAITYTAPDGTERVVSLTVGTAIVLRPGELPQIISGPTLGGQALVAEMDAILIIADGSTTIDPAVEQALLEALQEAIELRGSHTCAC